MENEINIESQNQSDSSNLINHDLSVNFSKKSRSLNTVFFAVLLIITGVAVFFGYKYYQLLNQTKTLKEFKDAALKVNEVITSTLTPAVTSVLDSSSIADWETYENSSLGFKIKYPPSIEVEKEFDDANNRATSFSGENLKFEVMLRSKNSGISLDSYFYMDSPVSRKINLLGKSASVYELADGYCDGPGCSEPSITVVTENDLELFHISFFGDAELSKLEQQVLGTFEFIDKTSMTIDKQPNPPAGWIAHNFPLKSLIIYTPAKWQSSAENFADIPSTLLRFWEAGDEKNSTIQLNITNNWDNMGIGSNYTYFTVAGDIQAYRIDPPKMEEKTLDRYQTNFYFERKGQVYSLLCVHNWMKANIETCEKMLQTMKFTD